MADPTTAMAIGAGSSVLGLFGSGVSAYGAEQQGQAQAKNAMYQAQVARNNAVIAKQNEQWEVASGEVKAGIEGMKTRAVVGGEKAAQGASGIDVNTGSSVKVRAATAELGALDAMTIRSNSARSAYGYEVKAVSDEAEAGLLTTEAQQFKEAGDVSALGTFLSGASSVGGKFASFASGAGKPAA
jgi:hypothetical protein